MSKIEYTPQENYFYSLESDTEKTAFKRIMYQEIKHMKTHHELHQCMTKAGLKATEHQAWMIMNDYSFGSLDNETL